MDTEIAEMIAVADACVKCRCGCCKDECPMYSEILEETISPKGRNILIKALVDGVLQPDERAVRIAYSCLLCRRDEFSCTAQLKNAEATETFRRYLVDRGLPYLPEHVLMIKSLENYGNPWQEPKTARKRWAKDLEGRHVVPGKTDTLFYVGCTFALDRSLQEGPVALAHLMELAGVDFGLLLEDEVCCGSTMKRIGNSSLFEKLRKENEKRLSETGVKRIVTACSGCYKTLKQDCPGLGRDIEILHSTEYLSRLLTSGRLKLKNTPINVTYHDPCHLGRHTEVYDPPRKILESIPGLKLTEMKNTREKSRCCGGGAGVKTAYPEVSMKAAVRRINEAEKTGADVLVTTCPFCVQTLRSAAQSTGSRMEVLELSVLLDRAAVDERGAR
ncbi:MAG: (Fe-S)-binding protein [Candidatus Thermoplasmatota archaeon]|nr:(Fe-S)-binding protein [Candidatus Thermoplasmatota archaeon]